jgi:hypothetical protein
MELAITGCQGRFIIPLSLNSLIRNDDNDESKVSVCVSLTLTASELSEGPHLTQRNGTPERDVKLRHG